MKLRQIRKTGMAAAALMAVLLASCAGGMPEDPRAALIPEDGCYTGVFTDYLSMDAFGELVGKAPAITMWYASVQSGAEGFPTLALQSYARLGLLPNFTWEFKNWSLQSVIDGQRDDFLRRWAVGARDFGLPFMIRWGHEMNGDWYAWCGATNGGGTLDGYGDPTLADGPERYVGAYRHIVDLFRAEGADNVIWVWSPNVPMPNLGPWNTIAAFYPGDEYVDWIAMDGYNWGDRPNTTFTWKSFDEIYADLVSQIDAINADKPLMIGEFASAEDPDGTGSDRKAEWITETFRVIRERYPRIRAFIWFQINKERLWTVDSTPEALEAYRAAMEDPYYLGSLPAWYARAANKLHPND